MTNTERPIPPAPTYCSDGRRPETCPRCGRAIGYAPFEAAWNGTRWVLTHHGYDCTKG